jgi:hypothetical protein
MADNVKCWEDPPKVGNRVTYNSKPGRVSRIVYEITYDDETTEQVECLGYPSDNFINLNPHPSFSSRYSMNVNERGGKRKRSTFKKYVRKLKK